jgi:parvulin-like peptidyl-prolyl isomerase
MKRTILPGLVLSGLGIAGLSIGGPVGCVANRVQSLDSRVFVAPSLPETTANIGKTDAGNASVAGDIEPGPPVGEVPKTAAVLPNPPGPTTRPFDALEPISELGAGSSASPPTTQSAQAAPQQPEPSAVAVQAPATPVLEVKGQGVYMTLGGVIAQVNDTPIYANQVLDPLKKEFAVKSRQMTPEAFRRLAEDEIFAQVRERIEDEMDFASNYFALSEDDRKLAELNAMMDRHRQIIAAGGSEQLARHRAADAGEDFDESIRTHYRWMIHRIYQERLLEPLIQVTADNMRDYYNKNLEKLFSTKAQAQFRVLIIDPDKCKDGLAGAKLKIIALREKAINGEDFAKLAADENDDDYLKSHAGCPGAPGTWIERNSYKDDAIDAAIWQIQPGQITPVIETGGKLCIAKLESRRDGAVRKFEDWDVQVEIQAKLRQMQMGHLWEVRKDEMTNQAMIIFDPKKMEIAVDMAMQQYAQANGGH